MREGLERKKEGGRLVPLGAGGKGVRPVSAERRLVGVGGEVMPAALLVDLDARNSLGEARAA